MESVLHITCMPEAGSTDQGEILRGCSPETSRKLLILRRATLKFLPTMDPPRAGGHSAETRRVSPWNSAGVARTCFLGPRHVPDGQGKAADLKKQVRAALPRPEFLPILGSRKAVNARNASTAGGIRKSSIAHGPITKAVTRDDGRARSQGGKMGRARSFAAAQDDSMDGGADNPTSA
jgi:hypothetical protein